MDEVIRDVASGVTPCVFWIPRIGAGEDSFRFDSVTHDWLIGITIGSMMSKHVDCHLEIGSVEINHLLLRSNLHVCKPCCIPSLHYNSEEFIRVTVIIMTKFHSVALIIIITQGSV